MKDFFISYTGADQQWAEWIAWQLDSAGYSVVIQAWDFRPGSNFVLEMQHAASQATRTIAVLSPNFLASRFTQPEWAAAFAQDPTGEKGTLVPVRVRDFEPPGFFKTINYINLVGADEATAKQKLLDGVKRGRAKPATAPAFPTRAGGATGGMTPPLRFPGTLPPIWNVANRNPNFTGREQLLADLRATLASGKSAALTALHGLGGIGKTQTAIEYAHRHASEYAIVWWVRSENLVTLASDLAQLAHGLDLAEKDAQDQRIIIDAVQRALRQRNDWLLIFDNATSQDAVHPFLPQGAGQILITSRHHAWKRIATPLEVTKLERGSHRFFDETDEFPSPVEDGGGTGWG